MFEAITIFYLTAILALVIALLFNKE